jgi:Uri superfamily endonuclease
MIPTQSGTYVLGAPLLYPPNGSHRTNRLCSPGSWLVPVCWKCIWSRGLRARIGRHARRCGRLHWHVEYLRTYTSLEFVWYYPGVRCEHELAAALGALLGTVAVLRGFGSSYCEALEVRIARLWKFGLQVCHPPVQDRTSSAAIWGEGGPYLVRFVYPGGRRGPLSQRLPRPWATPVRRECPDADGVTLPAKGYRLARSSVSESPVSSATESACERPRVGHGFKRPRY